MKNVFLFSLVATTILLAQKSNCQGFENFNNYSGSSGHYHNGSFIGQDGSTWTYKQCRSDRPIISPSPCLGKARDTTARVISGTLYNGCGILSFDYKQAYSTAVNLDVYVNSVKVGNVTSPGGTGDTSNVHNSGSIPVNIRGAFFFEFIQADSTGSGQVTIDNINWTCDTTVPEPTNYPTNFTAAPAYFRITLNWIDAIGGQLPAAYLVLASNTNNLPTPVDGVPVTDDPNLSDGTAALNIFQGVQTCMFTGLSSDTTYYFAIYPYTNSGSVINYKTNGYAPNTNATTPNAYIIFHHDFNDLSLSPMVTKNIEGSDQYWVIDTTHGTSSSGCIKISGYSGGFNIPNEDWLITPTMNFNHYKDEEFSFMSAYNYPGRPLSVKISNDYDGSGEPNLFTWTDLTTTLSPGNWAWTPSGDIDVSGTHGTGVSIAFKYTCDSSGSSTWEIDDVLIVGTPIDGITEMNKDDDFKVVSTPSQKIVTIFIKNPKKSDIYIYSVTGQKVFEEETQKSQLTINLNDQPAGVYLLRVVDCSTQRSTIRKLLLW